MKTHTSDFKEELKRLGKQQTVRITYTNSEKTITLTDEDINSATPNYKASLLKSVMKCLELDSSIDIPLGTELKFEYGLLVNGAYEFINYGNYIVYSSQKQEDIASYNIRCYDKMVNFMKDYEEVEITYPCTIRTFLLKLCTKCNMKMRNDMHFANEERILTRDLFKGQGYTFRDVLDQIAETTGGVICLTENDEVEVRYINKLINKEVSDKTNFFQFTSEISGNIELKKLFGDTHQETTSGKNIFNPKVTTKTYANDITFSQEGVGRVKLNGTSNGKAMSIPFDELGDFVEGKKYTVKVKKISGTATTVSPNIKWSTLFYPEHSSAGNVRIEPNTSEATLTFTATANTEKTKPYFWIGWDDSSVLGESSSFNNLILEISITEGTKIEDFEEYTGGKPSPSLDYSQEIETTGKVINIFDYITTIRTEGDGLKSTLNEDGSITTTGVPTADHVKVCKNKDITDILENGETYTLFQEDKQTSLLYLQVAGLKADGSYTMITTSQTNKTSFTVDKTTYSKYLISIQTGTMAIWGTDSRTISNKYMLCRERKIISFAKYNQRCVQIIKSKKNLLNLSEQTTVDDFSSSQSEVYTLPVQQEMLEGDYIDSVEHHSWGKQILNGSENWTLNASFDNTFYNTPSDAVFPGITTNKNDFMFIANKLIYGGLVKSSSGFKDGYMYGFIGGDGKVIKRINFKSTKFNTVAELKAYLAENPIVVYYKLDEPYDLELTDEQKEVIENFNNSGTFVRRKYDYKYDRFSNRISKKFGNG